MKKLFGHGFLRSNLRIEVFILISLVCSIQSLIIGVVIWNFDSKAMFDSEKENLAQLMNVVNQDIESRVEAVNSIALDIAINGEIRGSLNKTDPLELGRAKSLVNANLSKKVIAASHGLLDLSIIDLRNNTYSTRATYFLPPDFRLGETQVFQRVEAANGALVWLNDNSIIDRYSGDSIFPSDHMGGIRAAAVIKDYNRGETLGLLMVSVKENFFSSINYSNSRLQKINIYLLSPDRTIMYPVAGTSGMLQTDVIRTIDNTKNKQTYIMSDAPKTLVSYISNESMGWTLVSTTTTAEVVRFFPSVLRILLVVLLFSLITSLSISWLSSIILTRGIDEIAKTMKRVETGDFDVRINSRRQDEIGRLSQLFDGMMDKVEDLIDTTYKQQLLTQQAEFRALQAQINPHFLYNTLDMINWRLLKRGEEEISRSVVGLGMILQYSMSAQAIVGLDEEIQNAKDYLDLRKANRDPEFQHSIDLVAGENVRLPKLTLQPIVENAIVHGFGRRRAGNILVLSGYPKGDGDYCIEIKDNGIGIDSAAIETVLSSPGESGGDYSVRKQRIGLRNVNERLLHFFGPGYGLTIQSEFGRGTTVIIMVPEPGDSVKGTGPNL
jgi:two-component system sensor histidine kinase YesM